MHAPTGVVGLGTRRTFSVNGRCGAGAGTGVLVGC